MCATDSGGVPSTLGSANTYAYPRGLGKFTSLGDVGLTTLKSDNFAGWVTSCCTTCGLVW